MGERPAHLYVLGKWLLGRICQVIATPAVVRLGVWWAGSAVLDRTLGICRDRAVSFPNLCPAAAAQPQQHANCPSTPPCPSFFLAKGASMSVTLYARPQPHAMCPPTHLPAHPTPLHPCCLQGIRMSLTLYAKPENAQVGSGSVRFCTTAVQLGGEEF